MARTSLSPEIVRNPRDANCSYIVLLDRTDDLRDLAHYLTSLGIAGCDVVILDPSPRPLFDANARVLRWVGRHLHLPGNAPVDLVRCATAVAACEKVIVASDEVRYAPEAIGRVCALLDAHEVVEPQDYLEPLPWWSGIDAGHILLHRGIEPQPDHGATFGFRRSAIRSVSDQLHALAFAAADVFVQRRPRAFPEWLAQRPRLAGEDFALPMKTAFFLSVLPLLILLIAAGGVQLATGYAGTIAFASVALAMRGRTGATSFFPIRACLFAPLWVLERSVSVYWALVLKIMDPQSARSAPESNPSGQTTSPYSQHNRAR